MPDLFSDREKGPRARVEEEISQAAWGGIVVAIDARIDDGSFGLRFPAECNDGQGPYGCNVRNFYLALGAEIPDIPQPLDAGSVPPQMAVLDLVEFCHRVVARPIEGGFHSFFGHHHLTFEQPEGQARFREDINRILGRSGIAYELGEDGLVMRLAPEGLREALQTVRFETGDKELDRILDDARRMFLDPNSNVRTEAVRKLWDAWERLKTVEPGKDKKSRVTALLDKAAPEPAFRKALEAEAKELTTIGNTYNIRHSETDKILLTSSAQVDYLFHRLFAIIQLLLRESGRTPAQRIIL